MPWNFVSLDVETANASVASICQVGIVRFENGLIVDELSVLIDPEDQFDEGNIAIHGIEPQHVEGRPTFSEAFGQIEGAIKNSIVIHHGPFDLKAFSGAYKKYALSPIEATWLNNFLLVRHTWDQFFYRGYALNNLANHFNLELQHHDALSDARVAGQIACLAFSESGKSPEEWVAEFQGSQKYKKKPKANSANRSGKFFGKTILFTGNFDRPKNELENEAARVGFMVATSASKKVDLLVVGSVDLEATKGAVKTGKHRRIEELIAQGENIAIIFEDKFDALIVFGES